jgi:uncharacterized alpha-E superfamily protein
MGRYIERTENILRAVEWAYDASLLRKDRAVEELEGLLALIGQRGDFLARFGPASAERVLRFMVFDPKNPSSLISSLRSARENARTVWGTISPEAWESLNSVWLELRGIDESSQEPSGIGPLLHRMREGLDLFRGAIQSALYQDEGSRWIGLGTFLERADHFVRAIKTRPPSLLDEDKGRDAYYPAMGLLRWTGAVEAYRREYRDAVAPRNVVEFLIVGNNTHRSLRGCIERIDEFLDPPSVVGEKASRIASDLRFTLYTERAHERAVGDLPERLAGFAEALRTLGTEIDLRFREPQCA